MNTTEVQDSHHAEFPTPLFMPDLKQCWEKAGGHFDKMFGGEI